MKLMSIILIMILLFACSVTADTNFLTKFNPFTSALDYHISLNQSGNDIIADNFYGNMADVNSSEYNVNSSIYSTNATRADEWDGETSQANLDVNSATWWASVSGFSSTMFEIVSNDLSVKMSWLNGIIDGRITTAEPDLNVNHSDTSGTATTWDGETSQADLNVNDSDNLGGIAAALYLKNVVEDTTPQLGGNLDGLGLNITNISDAWISNVHGNSPITVHDEITLSGGMLSSDIISTYDGITLVYGNTWDVMGDTKDWSGIAMSSTGQYQTAVGMGDYIYRSTDTGVSWYQCSSEWAMWDKVVMSDSGEIQLAVGNDKLYYSTNTGYVWSENTGIPSMVRGVALSADGTKQTAVTDMDYIYVSTNSGNTWTTKDSSRMWRDVAMSADGTIQTAVDNDHIYISSDSGNTWVAKGPMMDWRAVAMSSDGIKQTVVMGDGQIYISSDSGNTWTAKGSSNQWRDVAMSDDGTIQTATAAETYIYVSTDSGNTWTAKDSVRMWHGVSMSSDGTIQAATAGTNLYLSTVEEEYTSISNLQISGNSTNIIFDSLLDYPFLFTGGNVTVDNDLNVAGKASIAETLTVGTGSDVLSIGGNSSHIVFDSLLDYPFLFTGGNVTVHDEMVLNGELTVKYVKSGYNPTLESSFDISLQNNDPSGITTNGSNIWILDYNFNEVDKHDMDGNYINSFSLIGECSSGTGITTGAISGTSYIWIIDEFDKEVLRYEMDGTFVDFFSIISQTNHPTGITTNDSNIWVVDNTNLEVYKYSMTGTYIDSFDISLYATGSEGITTNNTYIWLTNEVDLKIHRFTMDGTYIDSFDMDATQITVGGITTNSTHILSPDWVELDVKEYNLFSTALANSLTISSTGEVESLVSMTAKDLQTSKIESAEYWSGANQGMTDNTGFWMCTAADCSTKCQATIVDGLMISCT